jgi:hypothetical protein
MSDDDSITYESIIAEAMTEGFHGVVMRMSRWFEEPGRRIDIDVHDLLLATAEEVAGHMMEYIVEGYVPETGDEMADPCPACGVHLTHYPLWREWPPGWSPKGSSG